jgi:hypothetical protein
MLTRERSTMAFSAAAAGGVLALQPLRAARHATMVRARLIRIRLV